MLSLFANMTTSTASYKQQKEDFVSNLSGGSVTEICSVTVIAPVSCTSALHEYGTLTKGLNRFQSCSGLFFSRDNRSSSRTRRLATSSTSS
jgi:hypothetical protein